MPGTDPDHSPWRQVLRRRIARRRLLRGAAVAGASAAALAIVGCEGGGDDAQEQQPHSGGTLRFGTTLAPSFGLDPHVEAAGALPIIARLYGYPHHADPRTDEVLLDHLASYEQPDTTTYVLRLRPGIVFQDAAPAHGRALHADDIVLSMRRYRDSALTVNKFWHTRMLSGEGAPDAATVIVTTTRPYVYSMSEMGGINAGAILPREVIDERFNLVAAATGSGPMQLASAAPGMTALRRFDGYAGETPLLDGMQWQLFDDPTAMLEALTGRQVDIAPVGSSAEATRLREEHDGLVAVPEPSLSSLALALRTDRQPLRDERVRRAIDLALDRAALLEAGGIAEQDGRLAGPVNPHLADGYWSLADDELVDSHGGTDMEARRKEANDLIAAAGARDAAFTLQVANVERLPDVAAAVRAQLTAIALRCTIDVRPLLGWYVAARRGEFEASLIAMPPYEHPDGALRWYHAEGPDGEGNPLALDDAALTAAIDSARGEADRERRRERVLDIQRAALDAHALLPLFTSRGYSLAWDYVRDSGLDLPGSLARYHAGQWLDLPVEGRPD